MSIGIAILGAGVFVRENHLPAIQACTAIDLKAIYSRSKTSAEALAATISGRGDASTAVDIYFDLPSTPDQSLDALLAREDIAAVVIAVPINAQPDLVRRALSAGKHVLSEKPIAKDVQNAKMLIEWAETEGVNRDGKLLWGVAENWRFLKPVTVAAEAIKDIGGKVVTFNVLVSTLIADDDKFFKTQWRKIPDYQGGFLLDGGVHFVAGLRQLLKAAKCNITSLAAVTSLLQEKLAPVDTVQALLVADNGACGTFSISFGTEFKAGFCIEVVTTAGRVTMGPTEVEVVTKSGSTKHEVQMNDGVADEIEAYVRGIMAAKLDQQLDPREALADLVVIEAMLRSGADGGRIDIG